MRKWNGPSEVLEPLADEDEVRSGVPASRWQDGRAASGKRLACDRSAAQAVRRIRLAPWPPPGTHDMEGPLASCAMRAAVHAGS